MQPLLTLLFLSNRDRLTARQSLNHAWLQTTEPSPPMILVGSPSGQRRSVEATKDPDFHKPIKKSRCETNGDNEVQTLSRHSAETDPNEQEKENLVTVQEKSNSTSKLLSTSLDATQPVSTSFDTAKPVSNSYSTTRAVSGLAKFKFNSLESPNSISSDLNKNDLHSDSLKSCDNYHRQTTHVSSMTWSRENPEMERREFGEVMV